MARGGARPGAGRKKRSEAEVQAEQLKKAVKGLLTATVPDPTVMDPVVDDPIEELDPTLSPLDYMLSIVRNKRIPRRERMQAAAISLPFCHAKVGEKGKKQSKLEEAQDASDDDVFSVPLPPKLVVNNQ